MDANGADFVFSAKEDGMLRLFVFRVLLCLMWLNVFVQMCWLFSKLTLQFWFYRLKWFPFTLGCFGLLAVTEDEAIACRREQEALLAEGQQVIGVIEKGEVMLARIENRIKKGFVPA